MSEQNGNKLLNNLNVDDVQSVSAGGVSVNFRDKTQTEKAKWELELEKRRAQYNPLFFGNWNDRSQRR